GLDQRIRRSDRWPARPLNHEPSAVSRQLPVNRAIRQWDDSMAPRRDRPIHRERNGPYRPSRLHRRHTAQSGE
ncbi:hypothetical protein DIJ60_02405, partial [Burkholderia pseudomallei]